MPDSPHGCQVKPESHFSINLLRISDDMMQCLIFDSNMPTARLVGVEYVISQALFNTLPDAEKELWHSHAFEAKQGLIVAPGLPAAVEAGYIKVNGNHLGFTESY